MKILCLECSAGPTSAAVIEDGRVFASVYVNIKTTHSKTLLPAVKAMLDNSLIDISDIDGFAVSNGPGSFTGIRIGISVVKGLAQAKNLPCVGASTLLCMAYNFISSECIVCSVMDARCNQVYGALFNISGGCIARLCEDSALAVEELEKAVYKAREDFGKPIIVCGDGADLFYGLLSDKTGIRLADEARKYQNATGVGLAAYKEFSENKTVLPSELLPVYLRLPQAERELRRSKAESEPLKKGSIDL